MGVCSSRSARGLREMYKKDGDEVDEECEAEMYQHPSGCE